MQSPQPPEGWLKRLQFAHLFANLSRPGDSEVTIVAF